VKPPDDTTSLFCEPPSSTGLRVFSIDPERPFLLDLATALHQYAAQNDTFTLADAIIYLPTRRAVRALSDAFMKCAPNAARASLLPRIRALGSIDEEELIAFHGAAEDEATLPPAISSVERRLILSKLVSAAEHRFDGQDRPAAALAAADSLSKLLDSFYTEEISQKR